ncbi:uncharacterized [Tachysurus ichikawai]
MARSVTGSSSTVRYALLLFYSPFMLPYSPPVRAFHPAQSTSSSHDLRAFSLDEKDDKTWYFGPSHATLIHTGSVTAWHIMIEDLPMNHDVKGHGTQEIPQGRGVREEMKGSFRAGKD